MKKNELKSASILSYISMFIGNIISIVYTPVMLSLLGQAEYGLLGIANSVIGYLGILNFGFGSAVTRYIAKYKAINDKESEYNLNGTFIMIYSILSFVVLVAGIILVVNIENIFSKSFSIDELRTIKILMMLMIFNLAISFPFSVFSSIIRAYEIFILPRIMGLIRTIITPFIMLPLLLMGYKSIGMTILTTLVNILYIAINVFYCFKILKIKVKFKKIEYSLLKEISSYSFFVFLAMIVDKIYWNTDQIILGATKGTEEVAIYSIGATFSTMFISMTSVIGGMLLPKFTRMLSTGCSDEFISDEFIKVSRIQFIICMYIYGGFLFLGKSFIQIWVGSEYINSFYIAFLIMSGLIIGISQNVALSVLQAKNLHKFRSLIQIIIAILNLVLTIILSKKYGGIGAAFSTFICYFFGNNFIMSIYYYKKVKLNTVKLWKQLGVFMPTFLFIIIIMIFINNIILSESYLKLIIKGILYSIFYLILIFKINMNQYEKNFILEFINKFNRSTNKNIITK